MWPKDKIIHGDALDILEKIEDNFVDLGITSPPYNKGEKHQGWLVKNVRYNGASDRAPEEVYQKQQVDVLNELFRVIKPGGSFFYNHKTRWARGKMLHPMEWLQKTKWTIRQEIIWNRMIAANIRGWRFWQVDERIYWLYKPRGGDQIGKELKSKHALLTSVYIGIDISREYVRDAKARMENYLSYKKVVDEEVSRHIVGKTFTDRKRNNENTGKHRTGVSAFQARLL